MASTGRGSRDTGQKTGKDHLERLWNDLYDQIRNKYNATDPWSIPIIEKNYDTHLGQGKNDRFKSVVTPRFDPYLLCNCNVGAFNVQRIFLSVLGFRVVCAIYGRQIQHPGIQIGKIQVGRGNQGSQV